MGTIETYMLPVRVKVEYHPDKDGGLERACFVQCANGEILTGNIPFSWAQYVCRQLNAARFRTPSNKSNNNVIAVLQINGNPMQKTDAKVAVKKDGALFLQDNPIYIDSIKKAGSLGEDLFIERWAQLPLDRPVTITCNYHIRGKKRYNLALCNAWVLDLLYGLRIIKSIDHRTVKSMDGSDISISKEDPYTLIQIKDWYE